MLQEKQNYRILGMSWRDNSFALGIEKLTDALIRRNRRNRWINIFYLSIQILDTTDCAIPTMHGFRQKRNLGVLNRQTADASGSLQLRY